MTLRDYYQSLPTKQTPPRTKFIRKLMETCDVQDTTVRKWVSGDAVPDDPDHRFIISRLTGIPESELFPKCK